MKDAGRMRTKRKNLQVSAGAEDAIDGTADDESAGLAVFFGVDGLDVGAEFREQGA